MCKQQLCSLAVLSPLRLLQRLSYGQYLVIAMRGAWWLDLLSLVLLVFGQQQL